MNKARHRRGFAPTAWPMISCLVLALLCALSAGARAQTQSGTIPQVVATDVVDPMLSPPPAAPRRIGSWDEALALIRTQSPEYLSDYQRIVRAQAQTRIALAAVLPVINGQATYTHQFITTTLEFPAGLSGGAPQTLLFTPIVTPAPEVVGVGATLAWSIVNPRGIFAVGTAKRNVEVSRLSFEETRRQVAVAVVGAMLATLAEQRVAELNRVGLRAALERLALTQSRLQFGQGRALDVDRAQQDVAAARGVLIGGDESLKQSREALGVALGSTAPVAASEDLDLESFEAAVATTCRLNEDIERRPDVAAARVRLEVAERSVTDAKLIFSPSLSVAAQAGHNSAATLAPRDYVTVQGVLNVPLYDGGVRYGALRDSRAALEQARQALVGARLNAVVAAAQAERSTSVLQATRDVARQQRDLAHRIDERTRNGYANGLGTSLDLVTSAQSLRQADINLALLEFQVGQARANAVLANAECVY
jgi:outer membrane protein, multidrug efflux system